MARIVLMKDHGPLVLKKQDMATDSVDVCRCGLSAAWPMCDGTHKVTADEDRGILYQYARTAKGEKPARREADAGLDTAALDPRPWVEEPASGQ